MKENFTAIACLIDKSGSMANVVDDSIGGFNTFIKEQLKESGEVKATVVLFNHECNVVHDFVNLSDVRELTTKNYVPGGSTSLLDAVGSTINSLGNRLKNMNEDERPDEVIFVILTDGFENTSKEYNKAQIKGMIEHQQDKYNWKFVFLGANQDAFAEASSLGIKRDLVSSYCSDSFGTAAVYGAMSKGISAIRGKAGKVVMSNYVNEEDSRIKNNSEVKESN